MRSVIHHVNVVDIDYCHRNQRLSFQFLLHGTAVDLTMFIAIKVPLKFCVVFLFTKVSPAWDGDALVLTYMPKEEGKGKAQKHTRTLNGDELTVVCTA